MKTKLFVIPILVLAILTGIATPPVQGRAPNAQYYSGCGFHYSSCYN